MSQLTRQRIRLGVNTAQYVQVKDVRTAAEPVLRRGNDVGFEVGLFEGEELLDISNFASLTLEVKVNSAAGIVGPPLMSRTVLPGSFDLSVDAVSWSDESRQHALFAFTSAESALDLDGALEKTFYLRLSGVTVDVPARHVTLGYALLKVVEMGEGGELAVDAENTTALQRIPGRTLFTGPVDLAGSFQATSPTTTYLVTTFNNSNATYPIIYSSSDGINLRLTATSHPFTEANSRDPQMIRVIVNGEGWYYLSYTTSFPANTNYLGLKKSRDLVHWVDVATPNWSSLWTGSENQIWNGCWFVEGGVVRLFFTTAINTQRPHVVTFDPATDTFGTPALVGGDADYLSQKLDFVSIWKVGSTYHAFVQNNGSRAFGLCVEHATSSSLTSGWTVVGQQNWAGWGTAEGGAYLPLPDGTHRAYFMKQVGGQWYIHYSNSSDFVTWTTPTIIPNQPSPQDWVGIVAYSDLQTEQVLSAMEREVLANKLNASGTFAVSAGGTLRLVGPTNNNADDSGNIIAGYANNETQGFAIRYDGLYATGTNTTVDLLLVPKGGGTTRTTNLNATGVTYLSDLRFIGADPLATIWQSIPGEKLALVTNGGYISLGVSGTIHLIVLPSGNVGIGDTNPSEVLAVGGNVKISAAGKGIVYANGVKDLSGSGSPEGAVAAPIGSTYRRSDGGAGTCFYVKESGAGNTGWVAK